MADRLTAQGLQRFHEVAASHVGPSLPGLVALVAAGDQVHTEVLGDRELGGPPLTADTLFRIASTTKPITGAVTLTLVRDGLLRLDDPVDRWLPELADRRVLRRPDGPLDDTVPARRPVTVRDLLTFTFGFGMVVEMFMAPEPWPIVTAAAPIHTLGPPNPDAIPNPEAWIATLGALPLIAQPGERWMYNTGAQVLSVLVARATGRPFDEALRERLFEPLGMVDTAFWTADTDRLAVEYVLTPEGLKAWDPPDGQWSRPPAFPDGAAGLLSTAGDLLAFARMLLRQGDPILPGALVEEMTRNQLTPEQQRSSEAFLQGRGWGFCQAVATEGPFTGAFGWDGGLGTSWLVSPVHDLVVISLTQRMWPSPQPPAVHLDLQQAALDAVSVR